MPRPTQWIRENVLNKMTSMRRIDLVAAAASGLLICLLVWFSGAGFWLRNAHAANLANVSDVLSNSAPGAIATHAIHFTTASSIAATQNISITFDPIGSQFTNVSAVEFGDVIFSGATLVTTCSAGSDRVTMATSSNTITFTVCSGNTVASGTKDITISNRITNPAGVGSYKISIAGSMPDSGETQVAIVNSVTVSAAVDTSLQFTISPLATGTVVNVATTTGQSATTSMTFGLLSPGIPKILGQELRVITNAKNGFAVTVQQNSNMLSATGADINTFANGNNTSTPSPWVSPAAILDATTTYGHYGVTSNDSDLNGGEFTNGGGNKWVGDIVTPRTVFANGGAADGSSPDKGKVQVALKIEISGLQEAASDYENTLTYVCTPTF
jgi:hypothetical protein